MHRLRHPNSAPTILLGLVLVGLLVVAAGRPSRPVNTMSVGTAVNDTAVNDTAVNDLSEPEYPDAQRRALDARARAPRPVPNSALPPRHLSPERFPDTAVDRNLIVSGGPAPDAIASIDDPGPDNFSSMDQAAADGWLDEQEPVAVVSVGGAQRVYPLQIMVWHEIVNDTIPNAQGEPVPVTVTFCPLCNSVAAFERSIDLSGFYTIDGTELGPTVVDFGTSGSLYQSALVMYDRQTETLWTHFDGQAVVGDLLGRKLEHVSASIVSWGEAHEAFAGTDTLVLTTSTGQNSPYGESPYPNYLNADLPTIGFVSGEVDPRLEAKERVIGVEIGDDFAALPVSALAGDQPAVVDVGDTGAVVFGVPGTTSAVDGEQIAGGQDVGASGVFVADRESFSVVDGEIVDGATGSSWSVLGIATSGPRAGEVLEPVEHLDTFWFAWVRYHPDTALQN